MHFPLVGEQDQGGAPRRGDQLGEGQMQVGQADERVGGGRGWRRVQRWWRTGGECLGRDISAGAEGEQDHGLDFAQQDVFDALAGGGDLGPDGVFVGGGAEGGDAFRRVAVNGGADAVHGAAIVGACGGGWRRARGHPGVVVVSTISPP
jgi:hypothetical protein